MKTIIINIETEIVNALKKMNVAVGWKMLVEMVAEGSGRVQPVERMTIAKFVMSTDGEIYNTKISTQTFSFPQRSHKWR